MLTNRTPRSTRRRASRQLVAKSRYWPGPPSRLTLIGGVVAIDAVHVERLLRFAPKVVQLESGGLHPEGQLVVGDAAGDFGIADLGVASFVEVAQGVEADRAAATAAGRAGSAGAARLRRGCGSERRRRCEPRKPPLHMVVLPLVPRPPVRTT